MARDAITTFSVHHAHLGVEEVVCCPECDRPAAFLQVRGKTVLLECRACELQFTYPLPW